MSMRVTPVELTSGFALQCIWVTFVRMCSVLNTVKLKSESSRCDCCFLCRLIMWLFVWVNISISMLHSVNTLRDLGCLSRRTSRGRGGSQKEGLILHEQFPSVVNGLICCIPVMQSPGQAKLLATNNLLHVLHGNCTNGGRSWWPKSHFSVTIYGTLKSLRYYFSSF